MALKLDVVKGILQDNGVYVEPDVTKLTADDVVFKGEDADHVKITGLEAGDSVAEGQFFVGKFNETENKFVSNLASVAAFTVLGESKVDNVTATPTEDGANVQAGE